MRIVEKQPGRHVSYLLEGTRLSFREGELTLDLQRYQRDEPVRLLLSENEWGMLVLGPSQLYLAELTLPARRYEIEKGEADDIGFPLLYKHALPLDTREVTLTLWATEEEENGTF